VRTKSEFSETTDIPAIHLTKTIVELYCEVTFVQNPSKIVEISFISISFRPSNYQGCNKSFKAIFVIS